MPYDAILIDAGTGNLHSVHNALKSLGYSILVTQEAGYLTSGNRIILPGVGAFGKFMDGLHSYQLIDAIREAVVRGDPLLGICVGLQAFFEYSEEMGENRGLNLLPGKVTCFPKDCGLTIPHTGWNQIWMQKPSPLLKTLNSGDYVYFNHSYYCSAGNPEDVLATTDYGQSYASIIQNESLFGVQFHPEKSQKVGLQILDNFMRL